jgi:hypothetical protein
MTHALSSAEALWAKWQELCEIRNEVGQRWRTVSDRWREARGDGDRDLAERVWSECRVLFREYDVASTRADVVYARYAVAHYGLTESDVFDVD